MNETTFWNIIDKSHKEAKFNIHKTLDILEEELTRLEPDQILRFDMILHEMVRIGYRSNLLAAAYIINAGCEAEELPDFLAYLIIQGKEMWDKALKNPDILADLEIEDEANCNSLWEVPAVAYQRSSDMEDFEMVHYDYQPLNLIGNLDHWHDSNGKVDQTKLKEVLPNLYRKYFE